MFRNWGVGYKDDCAAFGAKAFQRRAGAFERCDAIMDHAPDIAEKNVVAAENLASAVEDWRRAVRPHIMGHITGFAWHWNLELKMVADRMIGPASH